MSIYEISLFILITAFALGCVPKNTDFNPFSDEFSLHSNIHLAEYDSILIECGYVNFTKSIDGLEIYYQFYSDEKPIVAKGFNLNLD